VRDGTTSGRGLSGATEQADDRTRSAGAEDQRVERASQQPDRSQHRDAGQQSADRQQGGGTQQAGGESRRAGVSTLAGASEASASESDGEFVLRFFEDGRSVGAVGNPNAGVAVAQGVQYLLAERGLAPRIQLPYAPVADGEAFLAREPVHPDGREMASAIDLGDVCVATGADAATLRASIEALAGRAGLRVMFAGDWPDDE